MSRASQGKENAVSSMLDPEVTDHMHAHGARVPRADLTCI